MSILFAEFFFYRDGNPFYAVTCVETACCLEIRGSYRYDGMTRFVIFFCMFKIGLSSFV